MRTLIRGAQVLTQDSKRPVIKDGAVLVEGENIVAVDTVEARTRLPTRALVVAGVWARRSGARCRGCVQLPQYFGISHSTGSFRRNYDYGHGVASESSPGNQSVSGPGNRLDLRSRTAIAKWLRVRI